jgi:hypothetical protein
MRFLITTFLALTHYALAAPLEPVALESGVSPTKQYDVVLEADKDTPAFDRYEMKGDDSQFPRFFIRHLPSGTTVGSLRWPGDPSGGDSQPLRSHTKVLWSPDGSAVAINTDERFYSFTSVLASDPKSGKFVRVQFPDYKKLTGHATPKSEDLKPRGFSQSVCWTPKGFLVYEFGYSPAASYSGSDPLHYRITLRVTSRGMEVISSEPLN